MLLYETLSLFTSYSASKFLRVREGKVPVWPAAAVSPTLHSTYSAKVDTTASISSTTEACSTKERFLVSREGSK